MNFADLFPRLRMMTRTVMAVLVFAVFPVAVLLAALYFMEIFEVERVISAERALHESVLGRLQTADNDVAMVERSIRRMMDAVKTRPVSIQKLGVERLISLFPQTFDLYVFDKKGSVITEMSSSRHTRGVVERAYGTLIDASERRDVTKTQEGILSRFLIMPEPMLAVKFRGSVLALDNRPRDGYFTWDYNLGGSADIGGYCALIHPAGIRENRALQSSMAMIRHHTKRLQVGMFEMSSGTINLIPSQWNRRSELKHEVLAALSRYDRNFEGSYFHGTVMLRGRGGYLLAISPKPAFISNRLRLILFGIGMLWTAFVFVKIQNRESGFAARIPSKLVGLFLFAVGIPSLILLVGGYYALKDHGRVMLQELESRMRLKLRQFDERFPEEQLRLTTWITGMIKNFDLHSSPEEISRFFEPFRREPSISNIFLINDKGNTLFCFNEKLKEKRRSEIARMYSLLAREGLKKINNDSHIDSGTFAAEAASGIFSSISTGGTKNLVDEILRKRGEFFRFQTGNEVSFLYVNPLFLPDGTAPYMVMVNVPGYDLEYEFMKKHISELLRQSDFSWRVNAVGEETFFHTLVSFPEDKVQIDRVVHELKITKTSIRNIVSAPDGDNLWLGIKGQNLTSYILTANTSLQPLQRHVQYLWGGLLLLSLLVFVSTASIGMFLSEQFLNPISDLNLGIEAIQQRKFDHQVPIHAADEFGEMAGLMNHVIEGMRDLQIARIVQESLFPRQALILSDYHIFGKSRSMTDLGGDYFDYFNVGETSITGLVGDVSGHGVAAALVMGMAKAVFANEENMHRSFPDLLGSFNRFMLSALKRQKMMTVFIYSIDPVSNILRYSNAGHNFPFFRCASTGKIEMLEQIAMPLGTRTKIEYDVKEIQLAPGDIVLFYTDGFVEASDPGGVVLGYDLARQWLDDVAGLEPEKAVAALFEKLDAFIGSSAATDDVSLIFLKRLAV
ncbi:MAG: SpoIIE family protein phosphatase [Candidatus Riflebacteria bacterium]|nr:SpoIIE family protein phosphatase [Candidatus Riflebacteria bacterium]